MSYVTLDSVSKTYGSFRAVSNLKVQVEDGEFFSLLGPSGCGKTTTLRMIAGFVPPTSGEVILSGEDVTRLPPEKRNVGIVFQNYAIFPHMTVAQNVGYGLKLRRMDKKLIAEQVERALQQVSMEGLANRMPSQLSGGQLQRVALARVIILEPKLLLLDEPLSALDKKLREEMRIWLKNLQHELGLTTIYVTHDQDEALFLSDRIAVMREGVIEQIGTPNEIYDSPATRFVADFIGDANIFPARVISRDGSVVHVETNVGVKVACETSHARPLSLKQGAIHLMIRPEKIRVGTQAENADNRIKARVVAMNYLGSKNRILLEIESGEKIFSDVLNIGEESIDIGAETWIGWSCNACQLFSESPPRQHEGK